MAETAEQVYARVVAAVGADGHLPMPPIGDWDIFPWTVVDGVVAPRTLSPPSDDPARSAETQDTCRMCTQGPDPDKVVWEDERWVLTHPGEPTGLPVLVMLHPRAHLDFGELDDDAASEFGRISNRLARIIEGLDNVGRCHVFRIGDGGAHMHIWFFGRTARLTHVLGSPSIDWDEIIPPGPEDVWRDDLARIGAKLANWGGHSHA